jgi:hypothetical protein
MLYDMFLDACGEGPKAATAFLAEQHDFQKSYLLKSKAILESLQVENAKNQVLLSRLAFGAQAVKSTATATIAIAGLFLAAPQIVTGAGIALGYGVVMEFIKKLGHSDEAPADTVVVGFQQATANDTVSVAGSVRQTHLEATKEILEKTLRYPKNSSTYRFAVATGARIDVLLKTLGMISAGVTLYTEFKESRASYEQMQRTQSSY